MWAIIIIMLVISMVLIVCGFIALLTQKIYIDKNTNSIVSEVEIPIVGKIKTNYPALILIFFGFTIALVTFQKSYPILAEILSNDQFWQIEGKLKLEGSDKNIDWSYGSLNIVPSSVHPDIEDNGKYTIIIGIRGKRKIEDAIAQIQYAYKSDDGYYTGEFSPKNQLDLYNKDITSSLLSSFDDNNRIRIYKSLSVSKKE